MKKNHTFDLYPQHKNIITELLFAHKIINYFKYYNPKYTYIVCAFINFGRNVIQKNCLFDEKYFLYYEETDYYYRLRDDKNYKIIFITRNYTINK